MEGASVRNHAHGKGHEEGGLTYAKVGSGLVGRTPPPPTPPELLEHLPQNQNLVCLISFCAFHQLS